METTKFAYFAGGCFWCITPVFREQKGVRSAVCGFSGGDEVDPSYDEVKQQKTHHRETIRVAYDPLEISYETLLDLFLWSVDPYDGGGQFIDRGTSYTLAVYYTSEDERLLLQNKLNEMEKASNQPPQIAVEPFKTFYPAPEEHQNFDWKHPEQFQNELNESGRTEYFAQKTRSR